MTLVYIGLQNAYKQSDMRIDKRNIRSTEMFVQHLGLFI